MKKYLSALFRMRGKALAGIDPCQGQGHTKDHGQQTPSQSPNSAIGLQNGSEEFDYCQRSRSVLESQATQRWLKPAGLLGFA